MKRKTSLAGEAYGRQATRNSGIWHAGFRANVQQDVNFVSACGTIRLSRLCIRQRFLF